MKIKKKLQIAKRNTDRPQRIRGESLSDYMISVATTIQQKTTMQNPSRYGVDAAPPQLSSLLVSPSDGAQRLTQSVSVSYVVKNRNRTNPVHLFKTRHEGDVS